MCKTEKRAWSEKACFVTSNKKLLLQGGRGGGYPIPGWRGKEGVVEREWGRRGTQSFQREGGTPVLAGGRGSLS